MVAVSCFQKDSLHFWVKRREQNKFQIGQNEKMWGREERESDSERRRTESVRETGRESMRDNVVLRDSVRENWFRHNFD